MSLNIQMDTLEINSDESSTDPDNPTGFKSVKFDPAFSIAPIVLAMVRTRRVSEYAM